MRIAQSAGLLGLCLAGILGLTASAVQQQYPGAIRAAVTLVPVNVTVTDKNNKPVRDLKKEDFTILEDGVPQTIGHFTLQELAPSAPAAAAVAGGEDRLTLRKVPTSSLLPQTRRVFVIVLGRFGHPSASQAVDDLIRFVRRDLLPQDLVAVMAWNRATDFTTDQEAIAQVLERYKKGRQSVDAKLNLRFAGDAVLYGGTAIPANLQAEIDHVFVIPGGLNARTLPPGNAEGIARLAERNRAAAESIRRQDAARQADDIYARSRSRAAAGGSPASTFSDLLGELDVNNTSDLPYDRYISAGAQTTQELESLYGAVEYLRYVDGEKHLLYFSEEGLFLPGLEGDKSIAAMANDARVTIESFQSARGVATTTLPSAEYSTTASMAGFASGDRSAAGAGVGGIQPTTIGDRYSGVFSQMFALQSLRNISGLTGGRASFRGQISEALKALDDTTRVEYLLGYYPSNSTWDGQYRKIEVKVNRRGVSVTYRHGYYARATLTPYDRKAFLTYSRVVAAANHDREIRDIAVTVSASPSQSASGQPPEVKLDVVIDPARLPFTLDGGFHKAAIDVAVFYGGPASGSVAYTWRTVRLSVPDADWEQVRKAGVTYSLRVPVVPRGDLYKVVVYNYDADLLGVTNSIVKK